MKEIEWNIITLMEVKFKTKQKHDGEKKTDIVRKNPLNLLETLFLYLICLWLKNVQSDTIQFDTFQ